MHGTDATITIRENRFDETSTFTRDILVIVHFQ